MALRLRKPSRNLMITTAALIALGAAATAAFSAAGLRVNVTPSYPLGIYRSIPVTGAIEDHVGEFVTLCLPADGKLQLALERGYLKRGSACPGGAMPLFKQLLATSGDYVERSSEGLIINGEGPLPNTAAAAVDGEGRSMHVWHGGPVMRGHGVFLSTHSPVSFDSRYLGTIPLSAVTGIIEPVWLWE